METISDGYWTIYKILLGKINKAQQLTRIGAQISKMGMSLQVLMSCTKVGEGKDHTDYDKPAATFSKVVFNSASSVDSVTGFLY